MRTLWTSLTFLAIGGLSVVAWNRIHAKEATAVSQATHENENNDDLRDRLERLERLTGRSVAAAMTSPGAAKPASESADVHNETAKSPPEPPRMATAEEAATEAVGELTQSGLPRGDWSSRVQNTLETWKSGSPLGTKVALGDVRCFARGCTFVATFSDRESFDRVNDDMQGSKPFERLNAPSFRSGPMETESGQLKAVWVLYSQEQS
jgi:hypothetical protein